jgi:thiol-disulfide isomerase/thioredoxin
MKNNILLLVVLTIGISSFAQKDSIVIKPNYLSGITTKADFKEAPYVIWFDKHYENYSLDTTVTKEIKNHLKGVTIKAFMGTWCGDSKREVPHLYKLLEAVNFNEKNLEMITVNRSKKTSDNLQEGLNIIRVPTIIFYKKDKEIGRYVEYPRETLEKDILQILKEEPYKHAYDNN